MTTPNTFYSTWGLMIYIDMCSEFTKETVPSILKSMPIVDMLYYCLYVIGKREEEKKQLEDYKRKHNIK